MLGDCEAVPVPTDYFCNLGLSLEFIVKWELHLDWYSAFLLVKRSCHGSAYSTLATLAKGIIAHGVDISILGEKQNMLLASCYLLQSWQLFDFL